MGRVRVGISGWRYPPWRGVFYPKGLPQREELHFAAQRLSTIEINGSFYALQHPQSYRAWYDQTPDDFVFSVKAPRFITHMKKLRGVEAPLANFFASGPLALGGKLGPILWQLPPNLPFDFERLSDFFALLPRSTAEAAYLSRRHDERLAGRAWTGARDDRPLHHALEVRHDSYRSPAFLPLLREHAIAVVVADTAGIWPMLREVTSDIVYLRMHGADELYVSGYTPQALDEWAGWILSQDRQAYVYFDNDVKVHAPFDAMALAERVER